MCSSLATLDLRYFVFMIELLKFQGLRGLIGGRNSSIDCFVDEWHLLYL